MKRFVKGFKNGGFEGVIIAGWLPGISRRFVTRVFEPQRQGDTEIHRGFAENINDCYSEQAQDDSR